MRGRSVPRIEAGTAATTSAAATRGHILALPFRPDPCVVVCIPHLVSQKQVYLNDPSEEIQAPNLQAATSLLSLSSEAPNRSYSRPLTVPIEIFSLRYFIGPGLRSLRPT